MLPLPSSCLSVDSLVLPGAEHHYTSCRMRSSLLIESRADFTIKGLTDPAARGYFRALFH